MKKLIIFFILIPTLVFSGETYPNMDDFMVGVRDELGVYSSTLLSDTVLVKTCSSALVWTSVDAGGVEAQFKFDTVDEQIFYVVADSIVEIVAATLVRDNATYDLKAFHPQYFEQKFNQEEIVEEDTESGPSQGYHLWADTLQLFPTPRTIDSIYLKCFVEHKAILDTTGFAAVTIDLRPAFTLVALAWACYLTLDQLDEFEKANVYLARYDMMKKSARERYFKHLDILRIETE